MFRGLFCFLFGAFALSSAILLGGCFPSQDLDDDAKVFSAAEVFSATERSTVALLNASGQILGTGTLLGDGWVLTAYHLPLPELHSVGFGGSDSRRTIRYALTPEAYSVHGEIESGPVFPYDIALIRFKGALPDGFHAAQIAKAEVEESQELSISGYEVNKGLRRFSMKRATAKQRSEFQQLYSDLIADGVVRAVLQEGEKTLNPEEWEKAYHDLLSGAYNPKNWENIIYATGKDNPCFSASGAGAFAASKTAAAVPKLVAVIGSGAGVGTDAGCGDSSFSYTILSSVAAHYAWMECQMSDDHTCRSKEGMGAYQNSAQKRSTWQLQKD